MSKQTKAILVAMVLVATAAAISISRNANNIAKQISTVQQTQGPETRYNCEKSKTAFDLLKKNHTLETKDTSFGKQVIGIDNVKPAENQYWAFYVDGKLAPVGADAYNCTGEEKVEWKLEGF